MFMKICVLASGSKGNCIYISAESTTLLVDFGICKKAFFKATSENNLDTESIDAILLTHSHTDHIGGLDTFEKERKIPLYATEDTASTVDSTFQKYLKKHDFQFDWNIFTIGTPFTVGNLSITPFYVPHDANGSVGFTLTDGKSKISIATDLGTITDSIQDHLQESDVLILEMNHDEQMLRDSSRPEYLKKRIFNNHGHLSNRQTADCLECLNTSKLRYFFPFHLSSECNDFEIVAYTLRQVLNSDQTEIIETHQNCPSKVVQL